MKVNGERETENGNVLLGHRWMLQFYARVVVELELRYVQRPLFKKSLTAVYTRLARSRSPTRRMHGIIGERERSNCVVDMGCIYSHKHVLRSK